MESSTHQRRLAALPVDELINQMRLISPADTSEFCEEIIHRFTPLLKKCWASIGSKDIEYQDFTQEVFLRLFEGLPSLREPRAFPGYFRRIALSVMIDQLRSPSRFEGRDMDKFHKQVVRADQAVLNHIFALSCLEHLDGREQQVVRLELVDGYTQNEIAKLLGITPGAVRMTRSRALAHLRSTMLAWANELISAK